MSTNIIYPNFAPTLKGYTGQGAFRFWCQTALPLVYDDSLSYYELLNKVVVYLNNVIKDVSATEENVQLMYDTYILLQDNVKHNFEELYRLYLLLKEYVDNYFNNLDVQDEINNKLDELVCDGTLSRLVFKYLGYITPEMFGAKGDSETDDTNSVNDCLEYAKNNGLAVMFCQIYGINEAITIPSELSIIGLDYHYCGLKLLSENTNVVIMQAFSSLTNITVDGDNKATDVISIGAAYCNIAKCLIRGGTNSAIKLQKTYCNVIYNNRIYGGDYGIICDFPSLTSSAAQNATSIIDNIILFCEKYALIIGGGDSWRIERNTIEYAKLGVAVFNGIHNLYFANNYIENCGKYSRQFQQTGIDAFYLRTIIQFNGYSENSNLFIPGYACVSAIIENNFINTATEASDNIIPSDYEDICIFVLANGINDLTLNHNVCLSSGDMYILAFGTRSANVIFDKCKLTNNNGFKETRTLGLKYSGLTVCPTVYDENISQYNYFGDKDFSDFVNLTFTEVTGNSYLGHKIYECSTNGTYGNFSADHNNLSELCGKTITLGLFANVPSGVTVGLYGDRGIIFSERIDIRNTVFNQWTFIGMALEMPDTLSEDFRFFIQFNGITNTPIKVSKLVLSEIGVPANKALAVS